MRNSGDDVSYEFVQVNDFMQSSLSVLVRVHLPFFYLLMIVYAYVIYSASKIWSLGTGILIEQCPGAFSKWYPRQIFPTPGIAES